MTNNLPATRLLNPTRGLAFLLAIMTIGGACHRRSTNERRYDLKGKVVAVEKDKHLVTIAHQDIRGLMAAMTMPFTVREEWAFQILAPGDEITATLVVDGPQSWLEELAITKESTDTSASTTTGIMEAKAGDLVPDYRLVNQDNRTIKLHNYHGKALLLTFIYTRCPLPDYCTLMSNNFAQIDQTLQKDPELYRKTHLLSISIDPEYDTPKVLHSYGAAHTGRYSEENFEHWEFASGSTDEVKGVAQFFGLRYFKDASTGEEQIVHGLRTVIVAPDGKVYKVYRGNEWKPEELVKDLGDIFKSEIGKSG